MLTIWRYYFCYICILDKKNEKYILLFSIYGNVTEFAEK